MVKIGIATGHMGQNYFRSLFAVGFQGLLILVCVAIYAVLIQSIAADGDPIGAIWGCVGYTVLLCFTLFKTGSLPRSVFPIESEERLQGNWSFLMVKGV